MDPMGTKLVGNPKKAQVKLLYLEILLYVMILQWM